MHKSAPVTISSTKPYSIPEPSCVLSEGNSIISRLNPFEARVNGILSNFWNEIDLTLIIYSHSN